MTSKCCPALSAGASSAPRAVVADRYAAATAASVKAARLATSNRIPIKRSYKDSVSFLFYAKKTGLPVEGGQRIAQLQRVKSVFRLQCNARHVAADTRPGVRID